MQNITSSFHRWLAAALLAVVVTSVLGAEQPNLGVGDVFPLADCVVAEIPLDKHAEIISVEGREIRVCCPECEDQFFEDSYSWLIRVDELIVKQQLKHYPLTKCIVDDKPLGPNAFNYVFRNRLFRLCSRKCQAQLDKQPIKFLGKLDYAVIEKQKPKYPLKKCVVSGKPLTSKSLDHVTANLFQQGLRCAADCLTVIDYHDF